MHIRSLTKIHLICFQVSICRIAANVIFHSYSNYICRNMTVWDYKFDDLLQMSRTITILDVKNIRKVLLLGQIKSLSSSAFPFQLWSARCFLETLATIFPCPQHLLFRGTPFFNIGFHVAFMSISHWSPPPQICPILLKSHLNIVVVYSSDFVFIG